MTIDERLERLTERHEALTQSMELLTADVHNMQKSIELVSADAQRVQNSIETVAGNTQRSVDSLAASMRGIADAIRNTNNYVGEIAEGTARLLHIAEIHEHRITRLEDKGT